MPGEQAYDKQPISIDTDDVVKLGDDLLKAAEKAPAEARQIVHKGAYNIKRDAQKRVENIAHMPHYPRAITFESTLTRTGAYAEIGPDHERRQGPFGNILEYGTVHNQPIPHMAPAGAAEAPRFEKAMQDLADKVLERPQ